MNQKLKIALRFSLHAILLAYMIDRAVTAHQLSYSGHQAEAIATIGIALIVVTMVISAIDLFALFGKR